ncbi:hypothetical protein BRADI_4g21832v3 [Brachypodium distachyon]|uniref:Uncharacterized protein n=1 Tax=Brachypodium distachyon TaxID=15368 RepID=A0A0Q3ERE9_BRADI|nr:hypothetical protein BRADI_4g21832v3 [Brachypodium distachyon]
MGLTPVRKPHRPLQVHLLQSSSWGLAKAALAASFCCFTSVAKAQKPRVPSNGAAGHAVHYGDLRAAAWAFDI